jgi:small subunit ribosomal protein S18
LRNYNNDRDTDFRKDARPPFNKGGRKGPGRFNRRTITRTPPPKDFKIEYKNFAALQKFITDRGKISSRRGTGFDAKNQRRLSEAIKMARFLGLLPSGSVKK